MTKRSRGTGSWRAVHDRYHVARAILHERFPTTFTARGTAPVPLKVGIGIDLLTLPGLGITSDQVQFTLYWWTGRKAYLRVIQEGAPRFDLDGNIAGIVTADHAAYARDVLAGVQRHRWPPSPWADPCTPNRFQIGNSSNARSETPCPAIKKEAA